MRLYVFSTPRYVGRVMTDPSGSLFGAVPIPKDLAVGRHTPQANGYANDCKVRSLPRGLVVKPDRAPRVREAQATVTFLPPSAQLTPQVNDQLRALAKGRKGTALRSLAVGYVQPTSFTGNDQILSTARSKAVKAYLRSVGLKGPLKARATASPWRPGPLPARSSSPSATPSSQQDCTGPVHQPATIAYGYESRRGNPHVPTLRSRGHATSISVLSWPALSPPLRAVYRRLDAPTGSTP